MSEGGKTLNYKQYARQSGGAPAPATVAVEARATVRRPPPAARLVCIHPAGDLLGLLYVLPGVPAVVGRDAGAGLVVADPSVSRAHARLDPRPDGGYDVADLGSSNGTRVNGEPVRARPLRNGDRVQFGNAVFLYLTGDAF